MKLTKESAAAVKKYGLMDSKTPGVSHAMIGKPGEVKQWIQIAKGPGSLALNPSVLTGAAGIMSQLAMQQAMEEITAYLVKIDRKVDDVLRAQKDNTARQQSIQTAKSARSAGGHFVGRVKQLRQGDVERSADD